VRIDAACIADADSVHHAPGSILLRLEHARTHPDRFVANVEAADSRPNVDTHPAAHHALRLACPDSVILPGLINAHTHLDLTHVGPRPYDPEGGFAAWARMVRDARRTDDDGIAAAVRSGIELCLAAGTVAVGDIAGSPPGSLTLAAYRALRAGPLAGVSFLEVLGIGSGEVAARARVDRVLHDHEQELGFRTDSGTGVDSIRFGLSPHAPNTVGIGLYSHLTRTAAARGWPITTHLAETLDERRFVAEASGPQRELLESFGLWTDAMLERIGQGVHPIEHLESVLGMAPMLAAHVNDVGGHHADRVMEVLARTGTGVVYCPRASEYFHVAADLGPHRYRDMLDAGVQVCLGTDSIINLPGEASDPERGGMGVLGEMALLNERDGTDPRMLLAMATTWAAPWVGLDADRFRLTPGSSPLGLIAVSLDGRSASPAQGSDPLTRAIRNPMGVCLLFCGK